MATMIGTVNTSDSVERRSADADSVSIALYFAASRTTIVARGKLQQTSASRANGLCTCSRWGRANRTAVCTVMRPSVPKSTAFDRWKECAARVSPTVNTATPDVADPIIRKQAATAFGIRRPTSTVRIPNTGPHRRGDFNPDLTPERTCARREDAPAEAAPSPDPSTSRRMIADGTTRLMAKATSPTVPALVSPSNGWSTAIPKTGVAEVASIIAKMIDAAPRNALTLWKRSHATQNRPT